MERWSQDHGKLWVEKVIHGGRVGWVLDQDEIKESLKAEIHREKRVEIEYG